MWFSVHRAESETMPALIPESSRPKVVNHEGDVIKYMSIAHLYGNQVPPKSKWYGLWPGHWEKAIARHDLYLMVQGCGGAFKYHFLRWETMHHEDVMVYCPTRQEKLPEVGIMLHKAIPVIMAVPEVVPSKDTPHVALMWKYKTTDNYLHSKIMWKDVA